MLNFPQLLSKIYYCNRFWQNMVGKKLRIRQNEKFFEENSVRIVILARRARKRSTFKCFTEDTANKTETNFLQSIVIYSKVERLCADPKRRSCLSMCWCIPKEPEESEKKKRLNQRECVKNRRTLPVFCQSGAKKKMNAWIRIYILYI